MNAKPGSGLSRRAFIGAGTALAATGCFGGFNLTGVVYDWNASVSSKWLRWLLFLGLVIVPVYGVVIVIDALILNSIEFWSGSNPVTRAKALGDGHTVTASATTDPKVTRLEHHHDGKLVSVFYCERLSDDEIRLLDASHREISRARLSAKGGAELIDGKGVVVAALPAHECQAVATEIGQGASPGQAIHARLQTPARRVAVARLRDDATDTTVL